MLMREVVRPVDRCVVTVVVDSAVDLLSTTPSSVQGEMSRLVAGGRAEVGGEALCCAQWGLSLMIETFAGSDRHTTLFDTGSEGETFLRNTARLGIDLADIDDVVVSHGHWDHCGGLLDAVGAIRKARGEQVPVHVNSGMFVDRGVVIPGRENEPLSFQPLPAPAELEAAGAALVWGDHARVVGGGLLSGEIPRRTSFERGLPGHMARGTDGVWRPDPLLRDERWLAVDISGMGVLVFTACSHAGAVNVAMDAQEMFGGAPLCGLFGGLHLSGPAAEAIIPETVAALESLDPRRMMVGHCTGWKATASLVDAFGAERVIPTAVGQTHVFEA